jgi:hypothetical protein
VRDSILRENGFDSAEAYERSRFAERARAYVLKRDWRRCRLCREQYPAMVVHYVAFNTASLFGNTTKQETLDALDYRAFTLCIPCRERVATAGDLFAKLLREPVKAVRRTG